jgi:hypothetical protein
VKVPGAETDSPLWLAREADALCDRFEEAHLRGDRPDLDAWLPAEGGLRGVALPQLALLDLECRVRNGDAVRVEEYFRRYPELRSDPETAVALLAAEARARRKVEPGLNPDDYGRRPAGAGRGCCSEPAQCCLRGWYPWPCCRVGRGRKARDPKSTTCSSRCCRWGRE